MVSADATVQLLTVTMHLAVFIKLVLGQALVEKGRHRQRYVHLTHCERMPMAESARQSRHKDYDATFGKRMRGEGVYADLLARRFALALKRTGFKPRSTRGLDCSLFVAPRKPSPQGELF